MKKRSMKILGSVTTVVLLLLSYNHCVVSQKTGKNKSTKTSTNETVVNNTQSDSSIPETIEDQNIPNPNPVVTQTVEVGVKNYEQILMTMAQLTGVSIEDREIRNTYAAVKDQLPTTNSIKSFQSANQVAIVKLAAEFCNELVESASLRANIWPDLDFGRAPSSELDNEGRAYLIDSAIDHFWMLSDQEFSTKIAAQSELNSLINDLLVGENQGSSAVTREIAKGVCISTLGSIHAIML
ncbi:hypothetical protein [Halobacteriovorax sp. HLS]|uniref:hypothetical protein n=1 Tax=Halobacteriovorax sp. HLS TaxID=2234000 RepID=UPI000FDC1469|nr:hypothetical protein [Halobacteriovorax sp. HLS]